MLTIPKCLHTHKITLYQSNTTDFIIILEFLLATCFDSYRVIFRPFKNWIQDEMGLKMYCGIPKAYIIRTANTLLQITLDLTVLPLYLKKYCSRLDET